MFRTSRSVEPSLRLHFRVFPRVSKRVARFACWHQSAVISFFCRATGRGGAGDAVCQRGGRDTPASGGRGHADLQAQVVSLTWADGIKLGGVGWSLLLFALSFLPLSLRGDLAEYGRQGDRASPASHPGPPCRPGPQYGGAHPRARSADSGAGDVVCRIGSFA